MSSFTRELNTVYIPETGRWRIDKGFIYHVGEEASEETIYVPPGFDTDFASVPWPASMFIPKSGRYNQAAVLHDYLYSKLGIVEKEYTRAECDKIFLEAMTVLKVNRFKRKLMYRAVRIGGGIGWNKRKKRLEKDEQENS